MRDTATAHSRAPRPGPDVSSGDHVIELRTFSTVAEANVDQQWDALLDQDASATVFHRPGYLGLWHEILGQRYPMRVHTFYADQQLVGIIADANDRAGGPSGPLELRRFLGGTEVTDYVGPVVVPGFEAEVADAYLQHLAGDVDWDELILGGLMVDAGWDDAIRRAGEIAGLEVIHEEIEAVCPRIDLSGGHDGYRKRLSGRLRQEMTRKQRKLARDVGGLEVVEVAQDALDEELDRFFEQAGSSFPEKASFFQRDDIRTWFRRLGATFVSDRTFRLHRLDVDGMPAAMTISLVGHGQWGLYNSAFDVDLAPYAPGQVLIWMLIEQACDEGLTVFDLLRGDEAYKYRYGAVDRQLARLVMTRPTEDFGS